MPWTRARRSSSSSRAMAALRNPSASTISEWMISRPRSVATSRRERRSRSSVTRSTTPWPTNRSTIPDTVASDTCSTPARRWTVVSPLPVITTTVALSCWTVNGSDISASIEASSRIRSEAASRTSMRCRSDSRSSIVPAPPLPRPGAPPMLSRGLSLCRQLIAVLLPSSVKGSPVHHLARLSLANRAVVALLTLIIAVAGVVSMTSLKQELIPPINVPQTTILTTAVGSSPELIDQQISLPLSSALKGVSGVETVSATSAPSVSTITVSTEYGLDQDKLESSLREAIDTVSAALPEGSTPEILAGSTSDIPVVMLTASSDASAEDLSRTLDTAVLPEIQSIEGVRDVQLSGETKQRITITPDRKKLAAAGLGAQSISSALTSNGTTLPAGTIVEDGQSVSVQAGDPIESLKALKALPLLPSSSSAGSGSQTSPPGGGSAGTGA